MEIIKLGSQPSVKGPEDFGLLGRFALITYFNQMDIDVLVQRK